MQRQMQASGHQWMGEIPLEWGVSKVGNFFYFSSGDTLTSESILEHGKYLVYGANGVRGYYDASNLSGKHILLGRVGALCGNVHIVDGDIWVTEHALVAHTKNVLCEEYYGYTFEAMNLIQYSKASAQPVISSDTISNLRFPVPDIAEQKRIAVYLDKKCTEINAAIEKTKVSIDEYRKLRQAIIANAVTKGIRKNRLMKDTGIKWIEQIPVEWNSINPKALFLQRKDKAQPGERQLTASQQYGVIYQDEYMKLTGARVVVVEKDFDILKHVEEGDFVISMRSFQGGLEYSEKSGSISSAYVMLIPDLNLVYPRFYKWLFKSSVYINALQSTSNLVRDGQAMRYSNFAQVRLYTVPMDEQREIADYLDRKCAEIDALIAKKEQFLAELENYKKALIYEYVTGKKEVPACQ